MANIAPCEFVKHIPGKRLRKFFCYKCGDLRHHTNTGKLRCKRCSKERIYRWRAAHPVEFGLISKRYNDKYKLEQRYDKNRKRYYHLSNIGLSQAIYDELFIAQDGKCLICQFESSGYLHIDHNHQTREVRGLLCKSCNMAIGLFKDNPILCRNAAIYLEISDAE